MSVGTFALACTHAPPAAAPLSSLPPPPPQRWEGLIGEYGADSTALIVLESGGRLHARFGPDVDHPLDEIARDTFRLTEAAAADDRMVFVRDTAGHATEARALDRSFTRRAVGTEEGVTFRITPVRPVEELRQEALAAEPPKEQGPFRAPDLVELVTLDSTIRLDIRYASTNNFMGTAFYAEPRAFLQRPAAEALVRANRRLAARGFGLLVHDAYRPWYVTKMFWDGTPASQHEFVADPAEGSRHNRGAAVDLTLYDRATGRPVRMPGGYDELSHRSYADYPGGTSRQRWLRALLREAMEAEGFTVYPQEWWHFDYRGWREYPISNLRFEQIRRRAAH